MNSEIISRMLYFYRIIWFYSEGVGKKNSAMMSPPISTAGSAVNFFRHAGIDKTSAIAALSKGAAFKKNEC
jgi:hypothetical protein